MASSRARFYPGETGYRRGRGLHFLGASPPVPPDYVRVAQYLVPAGQVSGTWLLDRTAATVWLTVSHDAKRLRVLNLRVDCKASTLTVTPTLLSELPLMALAEDLLSMYTLQQDPTVPGQSVEHCDEDGRAWYTRPFGSPSPGPLRRAVDPASSRSLDRRQADIRDVAVAMRQAASRGESVPDAVESLLKGWGRPHSAATVMRWMAAARESVPGLADDVPATRSGKARRKGGDSR